MNKVYIILAIVILSALSTWKIATWKYGLDIAELNAKVTESNLNAQKLKNEIDVLNNAKSLLAGQLFEERKKKQQVVTKYVDKEIIKYVQSDVAGKCNLPDNWVRIHDLSATGDKARDTNPTGKPDGDAGAVTDVEAITVVSGNYRSCNRTRDQLIELQNWIKSLEK